MEKNIITAVVLVSVIVIAVMVEVLASFVKPRTLKGEFEKADWQIGVWVLSALIALVATILLIQWDAHWSWITISTVDFIFSIRHSWRIYQDYQGETRTEQNSSEILRDRQPKFISFYPSSGKDVAQSYEPWRK